MKTPTETAAVSVADKSEAVKKAYIAIIAEFKQLIPQFDKPFLRTFTEVDYSGVGLNCLYGFYSPLVHIRLDMVDGQSTIYFARSYNFKAQLGYQLDNLLTRCVYRQTSKEVTGINIEDSLNFSLYSEDDYKQTKTLIGMGFKGAAKHTLEAAKLQS